MGRGFLLHSVKEVDSEKVTKEGEVCGFVWGIRNLPLFQVVQ